jgi:glycine/D-amino acid oxidase-like deaminating enzyme
VLDCRSRFFGTVEFVKLLETDYVVIGSGVTGLRAAIDLAEAGRVKIFTKAQITESNSMYAQGGIAAAIGPNDDVHKHYQKDFSRILCLCGYSHPATRGTAADSVRPQSGIHVLHAPHFRQQRDRFRNKDRSRPTRDRP